jgi:phage recombination protein Bet
MTNEIATINNSNLIDWNCSNQLETIKNIYAKNATNEEFQIFVNLGRATGLNPFMRELWLVKYGSNNPASIFIGRDGFRKGAQANPNYDYHVSDAVYSNDSFVVQDGEVSHSYKAADRGNLLGAYCVTKRKNSSRPIFVYVELREYDTKKALWESKKATMIKKVAEAQCLRMAFQELFAGTYGEEEYEPVDNRREAKQERATQRLNQLFEGEIEVLKKSPELEYIESLILHATSERDLESVGELAKALKTANERNEARRLYKEKLATLEVPDEFSRIESQINKATSLETLDLAGDLISSIPEDRQPELYELYNNRKYEFK